jgi:Protein of unknown function (DUF1761)
MEIPINYWAVLVSAFVPMAIGFVWYGPLFGKLWMRLTGVTEDTAREAMAKGMVWVMCFQFVGALLLSFVMAHTMIFASAYTQTTGYSAGLMNAFWSWLGFIVPVTMGPFLWEGKSWKLWALNAGYYLVAMLIMGVILSVWVA